MTIDQLAYLLCIPAIFLIVNKRSREIDFRRDFFQNKTLELNRQLMQKTLKRYFGETLTEKILDNQGDLKGDNIWVSILFTDIASYSTIIEHMSPEDQYKEAGIDTESIVQTVSKLYNDKVIDINKYKSKI